MEELEKSYTRVDGGCASTLGTGPCGVLHGGLTVCVFLVYFRNFKSKTFWGPRADHFDRRLRVFFFFC